MTQEIAVGSRGMLRPTTFGEAMEFAKMIAESGMVPTAYRGKPADVLIAIQMGSELGFAPMQALRGIAVINGQPSVYGDAALALVRGSGLCESVTEHIEGDGDETVAICIAKRRGQEEPIIGRFSIADAKKAQLLGKAGPWQQYRNRMLMMRARGFALRDAFPDVLRGVITAEEAQDYPKQIPVDITPPSTAADLDAFAAQAPKLDPTFLALAERVADKGLDAFRAWWKTLSKGNRDVLRDHLGALQARAEDADEDAFTLVSEPDDEPEQNAEGQSTPIGKEQNTHGLGGPNHDEAPPPLSFAVELVKGAGQAIDAEETRARMCSTIFQRVITRADVVEFRRVNKTALAALAGADEVAAAQVQSALMERERGE